MNFRPEEVDEVLRFGGKERELGREKREGRRRKRAWMTAVGELPASNLSGSLSHACSPCHRQRGGQES